jgi:hypothetical protein
MTADTTPGNTPEEDTAGAPKKDLKALRKSEIQSELKKMELCESCAGIQRNWRKAPGHPELVQGDNRHETRRHGLVAITSYRCDRCGTRWEYENNKADQKVGWSVVGR